MELRYQFESRRSGHNLSANTVWGHLAVPPLAPKAGRFYP